MGGQNVDFCGDRVGKEFFQDLESLALDGLAAIRALRGRCFSSTAARIPMCSRKFPAVYGRTARRGAPSGGGAGHGYDGWALQDELWKWSKEYIHRIMNR